MSLLLVPPSFGFVYGRMTAAATTYPVTVTSSGTAHTKGSWSELVDGAVVTRECQRVLVGFENSTSSTVDTSMLVDVSIDPSDTGDWDNGIIIPNLVAGFQRLAYQECNPLYPLHIRVPAGASIAVRSQGAVSGGTVKATAVLHGAAQNQAWAGSFAETIGANTADSGGTPVNAGNASWNSTIGTSAGNWHSLGTTSNALRQWTFGVQPNTSNAAAAYMLFQLGYGDGTSVVEISEPVFVHKNNAEYIKQSTFGPWFATVPAGATIYARALRSNATDAECDVIAYGVG